MMKKYRNIGVLSVILLNIMFLSVFFFGNCDYLSLMSRSEWESKNGVRSDSYLYTYDGINVIKVYKINYDNNGFIEEIQGSPFTFGTAATIATAMTIDPSGNFLYVSIKSPTKSIYSFNINKNGSITQSHDASVDLSFMTSPASMSVDINGDLMYISDEVYEGNGVVSLFKTDRISGGLGKVSDLNFGYVNTAGIVSTERSGKYLYYSYIDGSNNYINTHKMENNGFVTLMDELIVAYFPQYIETDNSGKNVYSVGWSSSVISFMRNNNGTLSNITSYSLGTNCMGNRLAVSGDDRYLAASARDSDNIFLYKINRDSGLLYDNYVLGCANEPLDITFDPAAKYIYVAADDGAGNNIIRIYKNNDNGTLSEIGGSPVIYNGNSVKFLRSIRK